MKKKSLYWKEFNPIWWEEIKSWIDFKNLKQTITNIVITVGAPLVLLFGGKIDIFFEELWVRMAEFIILIIWIMFLLIYNFIVANKKLFDKKQEVIDKYEEEKKEKQQRIDVITKIDKDRYIDSITYKQVSLINRSKKELESCYLLIDTFSEILQDGAKKNISLNSNKIPWNEKSLTANLHIGIPERIFLIKINDNDLSAYLIGADGENTYIPLQGKYIVQIRIYGNNFSPHIFSITFERKEDYAIEITNVTNPSLIEFMETTTFNENIRLKSELMAKK